MYGTTGMCNDDDGMYFIKRVGDCHEEIRKLNNRVIELRKENDGLKKAIKILSEA